MRLMLSEVPDIYTELLQMWLMPGNRYSITAETTIVPGVPVTACIGYISTLNVRVTYRVMQ